MDYKDENWQGSYLLYWMIVNALGLGCGVVFGELIGQWAGKSFGWTVGVFFASFVFEVIIWTLRQSILKRIEVFKEWGFVDKLIWFGSEMMGAFLGMGFYEVTKDGWMTFGPLFGSLIGTSIIITIWFITFPRPNNRTRGLLAVISGIIAAFGGSFYIGGVFVLGQEMGRFFQNYLGRIGGLGITGIIIGTMIGITTGVIYLRMKVVKPFNPSVSQ